MRFLFLLLAILLLVACEDTDVHTTPPAPIDSAGAPTVTIDPASVEPNSAITVTGQGFPPNTVVELTLQRMTEGFNADPLGQGQTDAAGNVTFDAQIPALWLDGTPLGGPELTLELATEDGDVRGVTVVTFTPSELDSFLTIIPASGAPGQEVQLRGVGFEPGSETVVRVGPTATELVEADLGRFTLDDDGNFEGIVTLPTTWPNTDTPITEPSLVFALIDAATGQLLATASFTNDPAQAAPEGMNTPAP